jgi:hypothetical protein
MQGNLLTFVENENKQVVWLMTQEPNIGVVVYADKGSSVSVGSFANIQSVIEKTEIFDGNVRLSNSDQLVKEKNKKDFTFKIDPSNNKTPKMFI